MAVVWEVSPGWPQGRTAYTTRPFTIKRVHVSDLPHRSFADQCRQELGALCRIDATIEIAQHVHQGAVLGTDEGTHNQQSSNALVAHYDDASICLGIEQMASHFSQEAADRVQGRMQSYGTLSKQVEEIGAKIDLSEELGVLTWCFLGNHHRPM